MVECLRRLINTLVRGSRDTRETILCHLYHQVFGELLHRLCTWMEDPGQSFL
jgi:hypothetical protein